MMILTKLMCNDAHDDDHDDHDANCKRDIDDDES